MYDVTNKSHLYIKKEKLLTRELTYDKDLQCKHTLKEILTKPKGLKFKSFTELVKEIKNLDTILLSSHQPPPPFFSFTSSELPSFVGKTEV